MSVLNKELAIVGKFDISKIQRAFGDLFVGTARSKKEFQDLQNSIQTNLNAISGKIKQNAKDQENAMNTIKKLKSELANPGADLNKTLKASDQLKFYDKWISHLKDTQRELKNTYRTEKDLANQQLRNARLDMNQPTFMGSKTLGGIGVGRMLGVAGGVAAAGVGLGAMALNNFLPFDKQMVLMNAVLQPKSQGTRDTVRNMILESSQATGRNSAEMAGTATQLFSSGLRPTAKEGTTEYMAQLNQFKDILTMIGQESRITGESMDGIQRAIVIQAKSFGLSATNAKDVQRIIDSMNNTLDDGIGTMDEYTTQFSKFAPAAQAAGTSMEFANATFAFMTQRYGANEAGHATKQLFEEMGNSARYMSRSQNVLARMAKYDILAGTGGDDKKILMQYADKSTGAKKLTGFFSDAKGNMKDTEVTMREIYAVYSKLTSDTAKNNFLTAVSGGNQNMIKAWRALTGVDAYTAEDGTTVARSGIDGLRQIFDNAINKTGTQASKLGQVTQQTSDKLNQLSNSWDVNVKKFVISLEGPINDTIDFLTKATGKLGGVSKLIGEITGYDDRSTDEKIKTDLLNNGPQNLYTTSTRNLLTGNSTTSSLMKKYFPETNELDVWFPEFQGDDYKNKVKAWKSSAGYKMLYGEEGEAVSFDSLSKQMGSPSRALDFLKELRQEQVKYTDRGDESPAIKSIDAVIAMQEKKDQLSQEQALKTLQELSTQSEYMKTQVALLQQIANKDFGGVSIAGVFSQLGNNTTSPKGAGQKAGSFMNWSNPVSNFLGK